MSLCFVPQHPEVKDCLLANECSDMQYAVVFATVCHADSTCPLDSTPTSIYRTPRGVFNPYKPVTITHKYFAPTAGATPPAPQYSIQIATSPHLQTPNPNPAMGMHESHLPPPDLE